VLQSEHDISGMTLIAAGILALVAMHMITE
jgi:hypothetical protein